MPKISPSQYKYHEHLHNDFAFFLRETWNQVGLPEPSFVQEIVADWLANGPRRRGIMGFRGLSKTWITLCYCLWRLYRNHNERITIVSKSENHAKNSLHMARKWINDVPFLSHLAPNVKAGQRDSATKFDVRPAKTDRTPSVAAFGIEGQVTGERSTLVISDDVETKQNTQTVEMRDSLREKVKEFDNMIVPTGHIVFLGTPHHEETLYDKLMSAGFTFRSYPARYPTNSQRKLITTLAPEILDRIDLEEPQAPVWPERFTGEELDEKYASIGQFEWDMQYMLMSVNPLDLAYRIRLEDFMVLDVDFTRDKAPADVIWGKVDGNGSTSIPDISSVGLAGDRFYRPVMIDKHWVPYQCTKMFIDPSGGSDDKTAWSAVGGVNGLLFVKEVDAYKGTHTTENLDRICDAARRNLVDDIYIESNFGGEIMAKLLETRLRRMFLKPGQDQAYTNGWACTVTCIHHTGMKEGRILDTLVNPAKQHRIVINRSVAMNTDLWTQMARMVRQRNCLAHEDEMDSLAGCVAQFKADLDQDAQQVAEQLDDQEIDRAIAEHHGWLEEYEEQPAWIAI